jgi:hypothetical protein
VPEVALRTSIFSHTSTVIILVVVDNQLGVVVGELLYYLRQQDVV